VGLSSELVVIAFETFKTNLKPKKVKLKQYSREISLRTLGSLVEVVHYSILKMFSSYFEDVRATLF